MAEFRCAICRHVYCKGLPDPDPESERDSYPGFSPEECRLVCDDCFTAMRGVAVTAAAWISVFEPDTEGGRRVRQFANMLPPVGVG